MNSSPISMPDDQVVSLELARSFGLNEEEYRHACDSLGRLPTYAELGVISVMWSEHCSYKTSRIHLKRLPTEGKNVVLGPGENAGAVDIGDGYCAVFKMESHNHPSFIEPYQGAATGVGGILRDVFTMGARPIASLNSLRFGEPSHPKTERLLRGVVAGIAGYGNAIGVPTVGGEIQFDPSYNGNILVNAFTMGIAKSADLFFGRADGVGNPVIYVGAKTGRDGIHGATMASAEFGEDAEKKLPTVQVGDPFMEKLLLECCLEIFATDALAGVQDMGAAGLTSSSVEMAARSGSGIELDLDMIPRRTKAMTPYEMLLSESQERMLMVAHAGREDEVIALCKKWDLDVAIVGRVTDSGRFVCKATPGFDPYLNASAQRHAQIVVDLPIGILADDAPKYDRPQQATTTRNETPKFAAPSDLRVEILKLLASPNIGSRAWVYRQFDHIVGNGTVVKPGAGDAAIIRAFCGDKEKFLATAVDCNGRHVLLDPFHGAAMAAAEVARNLVCSGAKPLGLTDCLNFGNPEVPETMWHFSQAIDGLAAACSALDMPVVSGNVSLYNETDGKSILPTPSVAAVGQIADINHALQMGFEAEGDMIIHLGQASRGKLGGGEWLTQKTGKVCGEAQTIDLAEETRLQSLILQLSEKKKLRSAHDISDGGFAIGLVESCLSGNLGACISIPGDTTLEPYKRLFSEEPTRVLVSANADDVDFILSAAKAQRVEANIIGEVGGSTISFEGVDEISLDEAQRAHASALDNIVG